jgi:CubicO group peptidase (beta-lactamase class C family)
MKKMLYALFLASAFFSCNSQTKPVDESTADLIKKVETSLIAPVFFEGDSLWTIEERMKHYGIPGMSFAIIKDNKIVCVKSYGIMDKNSKEPVTAQTLFQCASISKPVSAYAALKMVEQGKFDLDKNVNDYLKSWKLPDNEFTKNKKVTLQGILSHTAGLTVHGFLGYAPGDTVPTLLQVLDGELPANSAPIRVDKEPGGAMRYSGGGFCVLQQMMMDVEGKPFPQIMHDLILQPLQMTNSTYDQPLSDAQLKKAATGYLPDGSMVVGKRHIYPEIAPAGLWTTAEDLAKFAINVQQAYKGENNNVLSQSMAKKMLTPVFKDFMGLGIMLMSQKDNVYFLHGGWNEGFSSQFIAHKEKGYGVVVLINSNQPPFMDELIRSVAMTYNWDSYMSTHKKLKLETAEIADMNGRYYSKQNGLITLSQKENKLFYNRLGLEPNELYKVAENTYLGMDDVLIQFKKSTRDRAFDSLIVKPGSESEISFRFARMKDGEKLPYELLLEGQFEKALAGYQKIKNEDPNTPVVQEDNFNRMGYDFIAKNKITLAKNIFKIRTILYPFSCNAYDSYAEACMKNNEPDLAIENYKKSLKLNPDNKNAVKMIEELKKKKAGH